MARLNGGYIAWGAYGRSSEDEDPLFSTWHSADGRTWTRTTHAKRIVPCPGWTARPDLETVSAPASDGRTLVLTATWLRPDEVSCERAAMVSLATVDGTSWTRSAPFAAAESSPYWSVWAERTWAIPGGWETLVDSASQSVAVWRSTDLATWTQVSTQVIGDDPERDFTVLGASADGTRLALETNAVDDGTTTSTLMASTDGIAWTAVRVLPAGFGVVGVVPAAAGRPWLIAMMRDDPEQARVLVSSDLKTWSSAVFPKPGISGLTPTSTGWVAIGLWPQRDTGCGDACRPTNPSLYSSADGLRWTVHPGALPPKMSSVLDDTIGGVFAASGPVLRVVTVWRLAATY